MCGIHTHNSTCDEPDCRAVRLNPVVRLCGIHTMYAINPITVGNTQSRERCTTFTGGNTMCTGRCSRGCAECVEIALVVAGLRDPDWCLISTIPIAGGCAECVEIALVVAGLCDPDWCLISTIPITGGCAECVRDCTGCCGSSRSRLVFDFHYPDPWGKPEHSRASSL